MFVISDSDCGLYSSVRASSHKSIEAVYGDQLTTVTTTGVRSPSTACTVEGQLLSPRLGPGLHWICYQTV